MTHYDFKCPLCQSVFTVTQPMTQTLPKPTCNNCKVAMIRSYTTPAVTFRGTGWAGKDK